MNLPQLVVGAATGAVSAAGLLVFGSVLVAALWCRARHAWDPEEWS